MAASGEDKHSVYRRAQLGHRLGFGRRPAVAVIDLQLGFTDPAKSPLAGDLSAVIDASNRVIAAARRQSVPLVYTVVGYDPERPEDGGLWTRKIPTLRELTSDGDLVKMDPRVDYQPSDLLLEKKYASAFCGTHLASLLVAQQVDTLLVLGCTTSGCVRATVMDALFSGLRPIVPMEAVGDRAQEPHEANLFDIGSKYGDVVSVEEAVSYLETHRDDAPAGAAAG